MTAWSHRSSAVMHLPRPGLAITCSRRSRGPQSSRFQRYPIPLSIAAGSDSSLQGNALVGAVLVSGSGARVAIGTGNIEDPHTPIQAEGTPYKLAKKRRWSHTVQHAAVAGSDAVARPRILDLAPSYSAVRISGVKYDTGTTAGYWEALYRIGRGRRGTLRGPAADRVSDLSARALAVVSEAERLLFVPVQLLYEGQRDAFRKPLGRAQARLRALLGHASLQAVLDLVADPPNTEADQIALHAMAARGLRVIWQETASTV